MRSPRTGHSESFVSMIERLDLHTLSESARTELHRLSEDLFSTYRSCDSSAISGQRQHKVIIVLVAVFGGLAMLLGTLEFVPKLAPREWMEIVALGIATFAVIGGVVAARHHNWLLHRHKAERCQLSFWGLLLEPALWIEPSGDVAGTLATYRTRLESIRKLSYRSVERWISGAEPVELPLSTTEVPESLFRLYVDVRLKGQSHYFTDGSKRHRWVDRLTRFSVPLFVMSVVAALGHFFCDLLGKRLGGNTIEKTGLVLLVLSAAIPIVSSAVRVVRGALEPTRTLNRYLTARGGSLFGAQAPA